MKKNNISVFKVKREKISIKKVLIFAVILLLIIGVFVLYRFNSTSQEFIDKYVFRKEISEYNLPSINISSDNYNGLTAFDRYIVAINKNNIEGYYASSKKAFTIDLTINNPIFESEGRFLIVGEKKGQKVYGISNENIIWQNTLEGEIIGVSVNKNGYTAITLKQTSYKTVIVMLDPEGKEIFTTYLASTYAIDVSISNDNKYLSIAEVNPNGAHIKSSVKIISVEKAKNEPLESVVNTFTFDSSSLITCIQYQDRNKLVCMYDDQINLITNDQSSTLYNISNSNISFADIKLSNNILIANDVSTGIFSSHTEIKIINIDNNKETNYSLKNIAKSMYAKEKVIAINSGTEVEFLNSSGWLIRKYTSNQEIRDILLFNNAAGIVYRDKIKIIGL